MQEQPPIQPAAAPTQTSTPAPTPTPAPQTNQPQTYPGKGLGIAGFVLAFVGMQLPGLIFSIIGYKKAKAVGVKHTLAFVGIVLNSILLGLAVILIPIFVLLSVVSYNSISLKANTSWGLSSAESVKTFAKLYYDQNGTYPAAIKDVSGAQVKFSPTELTQKPETADTVALYTCGTDGNKIAYWDYNASAATYLYVGSATSASSCTLAQ